MSEPSICNLPSITMAEPVPSAYGVRKCGDHWHVCFAGEDIATSPNALSLETAYSIAEQMNAQLSPSTGAQSDE